MGLWQKITALFQSSYPSMGPAQFCASKKEFRGVYLDVRTLAERKQGTLAGSKHLDLQSSQFHAGVQNLPKEVTYFVFCRSGARSRMACGMMHRAGLKVVNLSGGYNAWKSAGVSA